MDGILNPFNPGAGTPPPALCGRDAIRETVRICIERLRIGRHSNGQLLIGLRGVGKTVLLERLLYDTEQQGAITVHLDAPEVKSLPASLAPALRVALLRMSQTQSARHTVARGLRALAGFVTGSKVAYAGIEVGLDYAPEPGLADCGILELDLCALLVEVGRAARSAQTVLAIFIDELQGMPKRELAALLYSLHRCAQLQLPVILIGAGLPPLIRQIGDAKSYAERMFEVSDIGPLSTTDACAAILTPATRWMRSWNERGLIRISCSNGGCSPGWWPTKARLRRITYALHPAPPSTHSTTTSTVCASSVSPRMKDVIYA